jgi:hypothetical protein
MAFPRLTPVADRALLVEFGDTVDEAAHDLVVALDAVLRAAPPMGMVEAVPAMVNLLIVFDPCITGHDAIADAVRPRLAGLVADPTAVACHDVPVCYEADLAPDVKASLERAKEYAHPTSRLSSVDAAYWTQMGEKEHLRWIMPFEEDALVTALARLHAAGASDLGADTRLVGMFRAQGLVVPVWDLPLGFGAAALEEPAAAFGVRLKEALATDAPMTDAERRARAGLTNRQVTLR